MLRLLQIVFHLYGLESHFRLCYTAELLPSLHGYFDISIHQFSTSVPLCLFRAISTLPAGKRRAREGEYRLLCVYPSVGVYPKLCRSNHISDLRASECVRAAEEAMWSACQYPLHRLANAEDAPPVSQSITPIPPKYTLWSGSTIEGRNYRLLRGSEGVLTAALTSVIGDLELTLRAAAISWSWLTNSVIDRRSSGFTFNIKPGEMEVEEERA